MPNTKTLLSIKNLKKYFPIPKSSYFQKEQLYVRANEDISIDIHAGETFGLVGESGCGKSTLGRVLLQLYKQTAGSTIYYGTTIPEFAPSYVKDTLKNAKKMMKHYETLQAKADECTKVCEEAGENADFYQHQAMNLAVAEAQTAFNNVVKILGGFASLEDPSAGADLLLKKYENDAEIVGTKREIDKELAEIEFFTSQAEEIRSNPADVKNPEKKIASAEKSLSSHKEKKEKLEEALKTLEDKREKLIADIEKEKAKYAADGKFAEYEGYLDDGLDLSRLKYSEMRHLRKDLQIIFQDPYSSLNPRMTVGQIIEEGLVTHNFFKHGSPKMKEYILDVMNMCGLQDYMLHRYPHQFSGGQRQRICIARALAVNPKFVVCDECVSALDVSIQSQIINLLQELKEKQDLTYLFISHDLSVVRYISDRIGVMYLGNLVELGDAETLFRDPRHPYTVALLSSIPTTDPESLTKERIILEGNIPSPIRPPEGCKFHTRCFMACDKCKRVPPPLVEVEPGHYVACHNLDKKLDENGNYLFDVNTTTANANR